MPQDPWLLDATLADNIALGKPAATHADVIEAAGEPPCSTSSSTTLPHGYDTVLGEGRPGSRGTAATGGAGPGRVSRARPCCFSTSRRLRSTPTSAARVLRGVRSTTTGRTALVVTHDPRLVWTSADRSAVPITARPSGDPRLARARPDHDSEGR